MPAKKPMRIKIVKTPAGQAKLWVRKAWVGLVLTVDSSQDTSLTMGLRGGPSQNRNGYAVKTQEALEILGAENTPAADYYRAYISSAMTHFVFGKRFCKAVK